MLWLVALVALAAGCAREVDVGYADVRGESINGVSAFVQLIRNSGRSVTARYRLPARTHGRFDAVILFPIGDDLPPQIAELVAAPGPLTLVLAYHDGDAAGGYYRALAERDDLAAEIRAEARRRLASWQAMVKSAASTRRVARPPGTSAIEPCERPADVTAIDVAVRPASGRSEWSRVRAGWRLNRRLVPTDQAIVLWKTGTEPLLVETLGESDSALPAEVLRELGFGQTTEPSQTEPAGEPDVGPLADAARDRVLELVSATPILNGSLVDPGNRALAEDLVARLPPAARVLVAGAELVDEGDGEAGGEPSTLRLLGIPPLPWVAVQMAVALGLFCWWKSPIFGRPRCTSETHLQDFGHHVEALGSLLSRSGSPRGGDGVDGRQLAEARLEEWRRLSASAVAGQTRRRNPQG